MLRSFSVKNYKGFKDEIFLDLSNNREYEFNDYLIKDNLVNKAIIYGRNSSGKSNLGYAIFDIVTHLTDKNQNRNNQHYLNANSHEIMAVFKYDFKFDENNLYYEYGKKNDTEMFYEKITVNGKLIFEYDMVNNTQLINLVTGTSLIQWTSKDDKMSAIKFLLSTFKFDETDPLYKMYDYVNKMLWFRSMNGANYYLGYDSGKGLIDNYLYENNLCDKLQKFLNDNGIKEKVVIEIQSGNPIINFKFANNTIPFSRIASSGTKALLLVFYWMEKAFKDASLVFMDEFDAFYHIELSSVIVKNVFDNRNFQTILTTHNAALINNSNYRPDIYYILNNGKIKNLPDSTNRTIREAHNLEKMFRAGIFED